MSRSRVGANGPEYSLHLLGGFDLRRGARAVQLQPSTQRLVAYLALADRRATRSECAGSLWSLVPQEHAVRSLRSAIWRLKRTCPDLVDSRRDQLRLTTSLAVDADTHASLCESVIRPGSRCDATRLERLLPEAELLPGWDEPWVVVERERQRLLRMHALEAGAAHLASDHPHIAMLAATAAVSSEPLRESAWRLVVSINLRQGNVASARQAFRTYATVLDAELGIPPSEQMCALVRATDPAGAVTER
jgi:DNA-binding SARP family transcriptional activator